MIMPVLLKNFRHSKFMNQHPSLIAMLYQIYAEIISRLTVDQDRRPLNAFYVGVVGNLVIVSMVILPTVYKSNFGQS